MPDARETLKLLARSKRHKGRDIKVPPSGYKPVTPKKIKRDGPTRPYQQNIMESTHGDERADNESTVTLLAEGGDESFSDQTKDKVETGRNDVDTNSPSSFVQENHLPTDYQKADSELSENREAENRLADAKLANSKKADNREAVNRKAAVAVPNGRASPSKSKTSESSFAQSLELAESAVPKSQPSVYNELGNNSVWSRELVGSSGDAHGAESGEPIQPGPSASGRLGANAMNHFYQGLHTSTENQQADNRLSDFGNPDLTILRNGAYARGEHPAVEAPRYENKQRSVGKTVTNLAKRSLIYPDWVTDFTRDESFLRAYFRKTFGNGKHMKEVDLYCQLYGIACAKRSVTLHFLSAQIGGLVGSNSNGTIRTRLLTCENLGLFIQQGFNNETPDHKRGTYIHLKFPWFDSELI